MSSRYPQPGDRYRHFKGDLYQVITLAEDAASGEQKVVYQALYGDFKVYIRAYTEFIGEIDHIKYPQAAEKKRFEYVGSIANEYEVLVKQEENITETVQTGICIKQSTEEETESAEMTEIKLEPEEEQINPDLLEFLEAEGNKEKIEVLYRIKNRMEEGVMSAIEASMDLCGREGSLEERIMYVKNTLEARIKYEGARLR